MPTRIYADMRTGSAQALVQMSDELCSIVLALRGALPQNVHLQNDFSMQHCVNENYKEQITCAYNAVTSVMTNKAFGQHNIPYTKVEGGVVPTLAHKFFETDLPFGLCTFKDIANMLKVETPLIDAMIRWNQKLIGKVRANPNPNPDPNPNPTPTPTPNPNPNQILTDLSLDRFAHKQARRPWWLAITPGGSH